MKKIMYHRWNKILFYLFLTGLAIQSEAYSQQNNTSDTLKLSDVIASVVQNNPLLKLASENINVSDLSIQMAKTSYLPTVDINGTYSRMAPIPAFDIPQFGHIQMYPDNGANISLEVRQLIYDFGRTDKSVSIQQFNKESSELSFDQFKQELIMQSTSYFYLLYYYQTAEKITEERLNTLKKHLEVVDNMQKTGSATQYEILSTQVELSKTETQLSDYNAAIDILVSHLGTIMSQNLDKAVASIDMSANNIFELPDSAFNYADKHRDELLIIDKKQEAAKMNYKIIQLQKYPSVGLFGSAGWKNGYLPEIEKMKPNYVIGLSVKVPLFNGNRNNLLLKTENSMINMLSYQKDNASRKVYDEITENYTQLQLSLKKTELAKKQVQQAQEAYNRAEVNFKEGMLRNLDLINAGDNLSLSKLALLKARIDFQLYLLKYKMSMGEKIY
jgi:outer membrane protein